jgi:F420H(2)-dependent quinone reductase
MILVTGSTGMDVLILHTAGRRSGQPRQSPVAGFPDGRNAWLIVAGGRASTDGASE